MQLYRYQTVSQVSFSLILGAEFEFLVSINIITALRITGILPGEAWLAGGWRTESVIS